MSNRFWRVVFSAAIVAVLAVAVIAVQWQDAVSDYEGLEDEYLVLTNKYYALDHPAILEQKEQHVRELEQDFNVRLVDGKVLWGFPEISIVYELFKFYLPWQVTDYFRYSDAKVLSLEIAPMSPGHGLNVDYEPCRNTIILGERFLRRDMRGFPLEERFEHFLFRTVGDAYDRVRGAVENEGFDCSDKSTWFFANSDHYGNVSDYYRELELDKKPESFGWYFGGYMEEELEDGPWCVRKRSETCAPRAVEEYEFMRTQVFCGEHDKVLKDWFASYSDLLTHVVSIDGGGWEGIREATGSGRFCNLHYVFDDYPHG